MDDGERGPYMAPSPPKTDEPRKCDTSKPGGLIMKWNLPVSGLMVAVIGLLIVFNNGCKLNNPFTNDETADLQLIDGNSGQNGKSAPKLTGEVEIVWKGGMGMDSVQAAQPRRAFVSIEAFEPEANRPDHGTCG
jgi:hypothetical protein